MRSHFSVRDFPHVLEIIILHQLQEAKRWESFHLQISVKMIINLGMRQSLKCGYFFLMDSISCTAYVITVLNLMYDIPNCAEKLCPSCFSQGYEHHLLSPCVLKYDPW